MDLEVERHPAGELEANLGAEFERRVAQGELELPVLPEAASAILVETSKPEWSASAVVELLKRDAAMAAHLLRLVNSPAFLPVSPIVSLQQAVSRLGAAQLRQLAVVIACETRVFQIPGFEQAMRQLFRHCLATALHAQELARGLRSNVEEAFLAGLLHDVGWPVLVQALVDLHARRALPVDRAAVLSAAERNHERVGRSLAARWRLSERIGEGLEGHHRAERTSELGWLVSLADRLALRAAGDPDVSEAQILTHPAVPALNLYPDVVDALLARGATLWAQAQTS